MTLRTAEAFLCSIGIVAASISLNHVAIAVSPTNIEEGRQLFERDWPTENPAFGSDGLGPLFNATSCVACHHQGGVGGGGDSRFNAKTVAIDRFKPMGSFVTASIKNADLIEIFAGFHPGFVNSGGVTSSFPLAHHGGSPDFVRRRTAILQSLPVTFSDQGGPASAEEVRRANSSPILASHQKHSGAFTIQARLYQRNTTSLFGAGLIDRISLKQLKVLEREQRRHPEISGRLLGRFGWRGNLTTLLEFCDQACANELGLQTKRASQASDPTYRSYRNRSIDISDPMIRSIAAFVAALPAPTREFPSDPDAVETVRRGEQVFVSVGCALCHVPDVGPAKGIYSDILLHDMGTELYDPNMAPIVAGAPAPPMRRSRSGQVTVKQIVAIARGERGDSEVRYPTKNPSSRTSTASPTRERFTEVANETERVVPTRSTSYYGMAERLNLMKMNRTDSGEFVHRPLEAQREWRTPPLWGVRDSAPYMHDGRAGTLLEAISLHEGEALGTRDRFLYLPLADRRALLAFLETLVAPPSEAFKGS